MWNYHIGLAKMIPEMYVKSFSSYSGTVDETGIVTARDDVVFKYDDGWIYCGSSGWTKAEKNYVSKKRLWKIKDHRTKYTKEFGALFHGDTFKLENRDFEGESMYIYEDNHIGCSDYGINDVYKICKVDMLDK